MDSLKASIILTAIVAAFILVLTHMYYQIDYAMGKQGLCYQRVNLPNVPQDHQWGKCQ